MKACSIAVDVDIADDWRRTGAVSCRGSSLRTRLKGAIDASLGTRKDARSAEHNTQTDFITIVVAGLGAK
jgi:hypothetical protein